jgi:replicative DNA helicase
VSGPRMLPNNIEAEQNLISGILLGAKPPPLSPGDFYRSAHGLIFEAALELEARQEPVDILTVKAELERMGKLQEVGGASYIASLVDSIPLSAHLDRYGELVREKAMLRRIISECRDIAALALEPGSEATDVLNRFQAVALSINGAGSTGIAVKDVVKQQLALIETAWNNAGELLGISTGFRELDKLTLGWQAPDLIVIAARPSMGKTAFALNTGRTAASIGIKVYISSLEMSKSQLTLRLLATESGINGRMLRLARFPEGDWPRILRAAGRIAETDPELIIDDTGGISELELARRVRRARPGLLIVDYLQLMRSGQKADRKDLEIGNITAGLKSLAKELEIPVILLSQLNRDAEKRQNPRPRLSDLRESGAIEQDADLVIGLYRPEGSSVAELICLKHRNGPLGTIKLAFREELASFGDLARD